MTWVADYTSRINPTLLRAAGVVGVSRYLSPPSETWKLITPSEYAELIQSGIVVNLNWEYSSTDWLGGSAAAKVHAQASIAYAKSFGHPHGAVIAGSADFNMTPSQWASSGKAYAQTWIDMIGSAGWTPGVYSHVDVLNNCVSINPNIMCWQSESTDYGFTVKANKNVGPHTDLWQRLPSRNIGGNNVDYNQIITDRWAGMPQVPGTGGRDDLTCMSDVWNGEMTGHSGFVPDVKTPRQALLEDIQSTVHAIAAGQGVLSDVQVTAMANTISQALINSPHNNLNSQDLTAVQGVIHTELSKLALTQGA